MAAKFGRFGLGLFSLRCALVVVFLSWHTSLVLGSVYFVASADMTGSNATDCVYVSGQSGGADVDDDHWEVRSSDPMRWVEATIYLPAGTYHLAARVGVDSSPPAQCNIWVQRVSDSTNLYNQVETQTTINGAYYQSNPIWFVRNNEAVAYRRYGTYQTFTVPSGTDFRVRARQDNSGKFYLDDIVIFTADEGYATEAEALAAITPPGFYTLNCTLTTSPVRALDIGGNWSPEGSPVMSYTVENGVLVATGDMTPTQEMEALKLATGREYFSLSGTDYCGPMWVSFGLGGRQFVNSDSFTISEWAFAEIVYWERSIHHGGPSTGYDSQKFLLLWESPNRFPLYGDPLGDVGYRIYQQFAGGTP